MSEVEQYGNGAALWSGLTARAKTVAKERGVEAGVLIRRFIFERFLARLFADPISPWVLKGGTAMLARVYDARTTKDIDLLGQLSNLDNAIEALRAAMLIDLGDHFRFFVTNVEGSLGGGDQPTVAGCRLNIDAYCGATKKQSFGVDLVTGSLMTSAPELSSDTVLQLRGIQTPEMRLYPVVDHVADKLCATQALYGFEHNRESSRVRDLVDLVVLSETQEFDGSALLAAIQGEWAYRGLPGLPHFAPPETWRRSYPPLARKVPACARATTFEAAVALVETFLGPVLSEEAGSHHWSPIDHTWRPPPR